ncbi:MAG: peptidase MA family metallohydrolase [Candidatus Limnocylindrales bacterium]
MAALLPTAATNANGVTFEAPTAVARLGTPLSFSVSLHADAQPERVELISSLPGAVARSVQITEVVDQGGGTYGASLEDDGDYPPNTTIVYSFRALLADGTVVQSEESTATVVDDRFEWRTKNGPIVHLHWYEGDEAFADRVIAIGEAAITKASTLLGVTETEPVDFFIYASEDAFRVALGPGTRENVGGQANAQIRTLFALLEPSEIDSTWVDIVIPHELTHLVFASAIADPYHDPPRWLNEGLAVYESQGYEGGDRGTVDAAVRNRDLIPLAGIAGLFPTSRERFSLAYAESVSAVDFFVTTYGQDKLVSLIRNYADGVTDDEAFAAATGAGIQAFDDVWMTSLGADVPHAYGPQPSPPGPQPADWVAATGGLGLGGLAIAIGAWRIRRGRAA